ncbi:MAG: DUF456 domain-containing protein [Minisyncoccales bacterium]
MEILLPSFSIILILIGLLGSLIPFLPGVILAWIGFFIYSAGTSFTQISILENIIFLVLVILAMILDYFLPLWGAKKRKASKQGLTGAIIGLTGGIISSNIIGTIIGPIIGAYLGEIFGEKSSKKAFQSAAGVLFGFVLGPIIKIILVLVMLGFLLVTIF